MRRLFTHRQLGDELRKSEARYRTVLDAVFDAIVTITPDGIVRWFNRGAERTFGHRADEVIGQPVTLLIPERYRDLCVAGLHRYLRTGEAHVVGGTTELVGLRKDGSEFSMEMSLGETHVDGERLFMGIIRDITERKRAEDALREARDRFGSVFDHAPIGMAVVSLEGRYLQVNRSLCEMLGYSEENCEPSRGKRSPIPTIWKPVWPMRAESKRTRFPSTIWRSAISMSMATRCGFR